MHAMNGVPHTAPRHIDGARIIVALFHAVALYQ